LRKTIKYEDLTTGASIPAKLPPPPRKAVAGKGGATTPQQPPEPKHNPPRPVPAPAPDPETPADSRKLVAVRQKMIDTAKGEVGQVDDRGGDGGKRKGWEHLKDYLEKALGLDAEKQGWLPAIQKPGGRAGGLHWCGIFAVWSAIQAGLDVKWKLGQGPTGLGRFRTDKQYAPGDILVCKGALNHHCVLTAINNGKLETVNGNSYYQSVALANRDPSEIALYYRLSDQTYEGGES
jgi:hypothetical protein